MRKVGIKRSEYFSKKLEGNDCQGFIKEQNLKKFSKILEETTMLKNVIDKVIKVLSDIRNVYSSCCGSTLDPKYEDIIASFKNSWQALIDEPLLKLSWTPKSSSYCRSLC